MINLAKINEKIAIQLCEEIKQQNSKKRISISKWQCWGCQKYAKGDVTKMCIFNEGKYDGCSLINKRFLENFKNELF